MNHRKRRLKKLLVESELARISVVDEILPTFDSAGARNQGAGSRPVSESCGNAALDLERRAYGFEIVLAPFHWSIP
jgi:hypothetical protein